MTRSKSFRPLAGLWELIIENGKLKIMGYFTLSIFNFQFELSPCGVWVVSANLHRTADPGADVMMGSDRKCLP